MMTLPERIRRKKQAYVAMRSRLGPRQLMTQAQILLGEVRTELSQLGIVDYGPAFFRYYGISSLGEMDIEFGYFTEKLLPANGRFRTAHMPAGRYVSATWTGPYDKLNDAHAMLRGWIGETGAPCDWRKSDSGVTFGCHLNIFHLSMLHEADPNKWITEIVYALRDA
jgi:effector-binding domain-containing protein